MFGSGVCVRLGGGVFAVAVAFVMALASAAGAQVPYRQANGASFAPSVSGSGRVMAVGSAASNLVAGDTNRAQDVFVYDFGQLKTSRISVASSGAEANGDSSQPAVSADGNYVAFRSSASNLVGGDTNATDDVFVFDRMTASTSRVSVGSVGAQANGASSAPSISRDGRYVAFRSAASNLVGADTNGVDDVFVRDRVAGTTTRVSLSSGGAEANAASGAPEISADGGLVAFDSSASNLVGGDTNGASDVFARSLAVGSTTRVSITAWGGQAGGASRSASVSADGSRIAFQSTAALASTDYNAASDIYVRDRAAGTTSWASKWAANQGWQTGGASTSPAISGDGRHVALVLHSDVNLSDLRERLLFR